MPDDWSEMGAKHIIIGALIGGVALGLLTGGNLIGVAGGAAVGAVLGGVYQMLKD